MPIHNNNVETNRFEVNLSWLIFLYLVLNLANHNLNFLFFVDSFGFDNVQCPIFKLKTSKILAQGQMVSVHRPHHTTLPYAESYLEPVFGFCPFKKGVGNVKCVIKVCLYFKRVMKELPDECVMKACLHLQRVNKRLPIRMHMRSTFMC